MPPDPDPVLEAEPEPEASDAPDAVPDPEPDPLDDAELELAAPPGPPSGALGLGQQAPTIEIEAAAKSARQKGDFAGSMVIRTASRPHPQRAYGPDASAPGNGSRNRHWAPNGHHGAKKPSVEELRRVSAARAP
jgi:hypothetical protein